MSFRLKDPDSTLDWTLDWTDWLSTGESVASASWFITPVTGTAPLTESTSSFQATNTTIFVTGGDKGETYRVVCRMTTDSSPARTVDRTVTIRVGER